jgi:polyhydroxyalkanoate synthesis regulator phasin
MSDEKKRDVPFDVAGAIENAFLLGIGVLETTRERTTELTDELIERGRLSKSDAKKVADRISEIAEEQQESIRSTVAKETDKAMKTSGVVTRDDLEELQAQIAELKALVIAATGATVEAVAANAHEETPSE